MINLTNNQVIAFNRIFTLQSKNEPFLLDVKISINAISFIIKSKHRRICLYHIWKSSIECGSYIKKSDYDTLILKRKYKYKLKKR